MRDTPAIGVFMAEEAIDTEGDVGLGNAGMGGGLASSGPGLCRFILARLKALCPGPENAPELRQDNRT